MLAKCGEAAGEASPRRVDHAVSQPRWLCRRCRVGVREVSMLGSLIFSAARASRSVRVWRGALLLVGALGLAVATFQTIPSAQASTALHYQRGYYLDNGWYCYGWAN